MNLQYCGIQVIFLFVVDRLVLRSLVKWSTNWRHQQILYPTESNQSIMGFKVLNDSLDDCSCLILPRTDPTSYVISSATCVLYNLFDFAVSIFFAISLSYVFFFFWTFHVPYTYIGFHNWLPVSIFLLLFRRVIGSFLVSSWSVTSLRPMVTEPVSWKDSAPRR